MSVIYVLLAISLSVAAIFFTVFIISVRQGQYDDSYTPSVRMLFEDELVKPQSPQKNPNPERSEDLQSEWSYTQKETN